MRFVRVFWSWWSDHLGWPEAGAAILDDIKLHPSGLFYSTDHQGLNAKEVQLIADHLAERAAKLRSAMEQKATLTLTSPNFANPDGTSPGSIVVPVAQERWSLPFTGDFKATATSVAGFPTLEENIAASLKIDGFTVWSNTIANFPIDIPTAVGPVIAEIFEKENITAVFEVSSQ